ncbi:MAG: glycosyltransferase family 2 protein [Patescibacteria group bacterium]|jgi:glycosyltransferase involved in cell wall biosynthesis
MNINQCSIVVCTYNRPDYLKRCIASLLEINFPKYEIIIVNDGSTDDTKNFLDNLKNERIKVVHHQYNRGLSASRNAGIKHTNFDIIAFTDDDCEVDKNWLTELLKGFTSESTGFVIGQTFYISKNYKGYFPERLVSNLNAKWPMGCNIAYRKKVFITCGDFDNFFFKYNNEDSEMAIRAVSKGFSFDRTPIAIVYHQAMDWTTKSILRSARNASVWPILKEKYPNHYLLFGPPVKFNLIVNMEDYLYLLTAPIFIPLLFIRYVIHGGKKLKIFFTKWPIYLILRRYYIYKEAIKNKVLMF